MNYLHLMKKVAIAILCVSSVANSQDKRFAFKGNAAQAGSSGISTATARQNTGWTSNGTLARDTLATNYALFGAKTFGVGGTTQAQNARAKFNVVGFGDTLAVFIGDGNRAPGDSSTIIRDDGSILIRGATPSTAGLSLVASGQIESALGFRTSLNAVTHTGTGSAYKFISPGTNIHIDPAGSGQILMSPNGVATQAYVTIRNSALADTLWMARNDVNSTLDSTAMVFADGRIYRSDTKQLPAGAWLATASNGAALSSSNYIVTYAFDQTTAETLTVDFALPPNFGMINNVEIEVISPNTDGDSAGYAVAWLGRAADEAFDVAFSSPLSGQIDLGTTANARKILTISGTFSNLAASDRIIFKLWRDPSVDNNVAADVHFVDMRVNGVGLLH